MQKKKLLALYNFSRRETDENNPLSTAEIIEGLKPDGIAVERKALINDINVLNEWGYVVNPLALVLNDNNYYLVCYNDKYKGLSNYRIDRMENAATGNDEITPVKEFENFNLSEYCKQTFSMFTGELLTAELEADNGMIDGILDRFGKDVNVAISSTL